MTPQSINPSALPFVSFADRKQLPSGPGVYFVMDGATVIYIGRAVNLRNRWVAHHRLIQFRAISGARIVWLEINDVSLLDSVERACIDYFCPSLNRTTTGERPDGEMARIRRDLYERLRQLANREGRSISAQLSIILERALDNADNTEVKPTGAK
jgi:hypothetical protein